MNMNLPLLAKIIAAMEAANELDWSRTLNNPQSSSALEVARDESGTIRFGLHESVEGNRSTLFEGMAKLNEDGSMEIDPESHAAYQSFVEASRAFAL